MGSRYSQPYRVIAIALCLMLLPLPTFSQQQSSSQAAGEISALIPQATRNGNIAAAKERVFWNDTLRTEGAGRARVTLQDGSILSLGSNSELKVVQHDPASQQTELELNYGRLRSKVTPITKPGGKFTVKTPTASAGVIGTDFVVIYEGGHMQVIVYSGIVQVTGPTGAVIATVNPGQMVDVVNGVASPPSPAPPSVQTNGLTTTGIGHAAGGAAGGGAAGGAAAGGIIHTVLIVVAAAVTSSIVTVVAPPGAHSGGSTPGPTTSPTSCPDCPAPTNRRH
jgi:hypothetical protein